MATAGMRFCRECNNMLYPREDRESRTLKFACRNCGHSEDVHERCIYVNEIVKDTRMQLGIIPEDIMDDPCLQKNPECQCPRCNSIGAAYLRSHDGTKESTLALVWVCLNPRCRFKWLE